MYTKHITCILRRNSKDEYANYAPLTEPYPEVCIRNVSETIPVEEIAPIHYFKSCKV